MENKAKLTTIGRGRAEAVFQRELTRVVENLFDKATDPTKKRSITLVIDFVPDKDNIPGETFRVNTSVSARSSLAPYKSVTDTVFLSEGAEGQIEATTTDPKEENVISSVLAAAKMLREEVKNG